MKTSILFLVPLSILLFSCSASHKLAECYSGVVKTNPNSFCFFEDSTFSYEFWGLGHFYKYSSGSWELKGRNVVLNSSIQDKAPRMEVSVEKVYVPINRVEVSIITMDDEKAEDYRCSVFINGTLTPSQANGNCVFPSDVALIKTLSFVVWKRPAEFYLYKLPKYPRKTKQLKNVTTSLGHVIKINLYIDDSSLFNYRVFMNKSLKVGTDHIIFRDDEERKMKNKLYIEPVEQKK